MGSYTSNLNLLKKDPTVDGNDTFNIKTMLNDNWDKIDDYVAKRKKTVVYIEESQNWTVPANVYEVDVFLIGGGAAGTGGSKSGVGGDGGAGGFATTETIAVTPGEVIPVVIGAGGTPHNGYSVSESSLGGESKFGNYLSCRGGGMYDPPTAWRLSSGGAGGGQGEGTNAVGKNGGSGVGDSAEGERGTINAVSQDDAKGGKVLCHNYKGAYCPMNGQLYGGGGGGASGDTAATTGGLGGDGGGGAGGWNQEGHYEGQDGHLYGAGGGGSCYKKTAGNGHAGVCIIAY